MDTTCGRRRNPRKEGKCKMYGTNAPSGRCEETLDSSEVDNREKKLREFWNRQRNNYIENRQAGDKMMLTPCGRGACVMVVTCVGGGGTSITVDSGKVFVLGVVDMSCLE